jgi:hypothetical protein
MFSCIFMHLRSNLADSSCVPFEDPLKYHAFLAFANFGLDYSRAKRGCYDSCAPILRASNHEELWSFIWNYIHNSLIYSDFTDVMSENPAGIRHVFAWLPLPSQNTQSCYHTSCGRMTYDSDGTWFVFLGSRVIEWWEFILVPVLVNCSRRRTVISPLPHSRSLSPA